MARILAPDFIALTLDGRHLTREQYLDTEYPAEATAAPPIDTRVSDFRARRIGQTLVLAYTEVERADIGGQPFANRLARLDVYVRMGGEWRLQTMSAARIATPPQVIIVPAE